MESIDTQIFLAYLEYRCFVRKFSYRPPESFSEFRAKSLADLERIHVWLRGKDHDTPN